ncbi:META domain-containing protein [Sphingomonas sp. LHG3406-1]|uniref:META domain-containing protein n=1 Tax=Sphingomonas sp. LHG3406-1 TaxID=2804617 RepID=UPI00260D6306|nr:META domain-containing protein [Sphingomonas sp. LHG3406-1]
MTRPMLLLPLLLAACASGPVPLPPPDADVRPVVQKDNLDGRWTIAALNGRAISGMSVEFTGPSMRVALACNGGAATITRNGDKLFLQQLALTERGCEPERMQVDEQAAAVLRQPMTMELTPPDRLRLINAGGIIDLVRNEGAK